MSIGELWEMTMKCLLAVGALALGAYATYAEDPAEKGLQSVLNNPNDRMPQPCLLRDNRVSPEEMTQARIKGTFQDAVLSWKLHRRSLRSLGATSTKGDALVASRAAVSTV